MADGSVRDEITAALVAAHGWATCESDTADALLPVVERLQRQAAAKALAETLTKLADAWYHEHRYDSGGTEYACGYEDGWTQAADLLRERARIELRDRADGIEAT